MPFDFAGFDVVAAEDLRIMRATLASLSRRRNFTTGTFGRGEGAPHCVIGWLNVHSTDPVRSSPGLAETGFRIAAERLYPVLPAIPKVPGGKFCDPRAAAVMAFNDSYGWWRTRRMLAAAIKHLEETTGQAPEKKRYWPVWW